MVSIPFIAVLCIDSNIGNAIDIANNVKVKPIMNFIAYLNFFSFSSQYAKYANVIAIIYVSIIERNIIHIPLNIQNAVGCLK